MWYPSPYRFIAASLTLKENGRGHILTLASEKKQTFTYQSKRSGIGSCHLVAFLSGLIDMDQLIDMPDTPQLRQQAVVFHGTVYLCQLLYNTVHESVLPNRKHWSYLTKQPSGMPTSISSVFPLAPRITILLPRPSEGSGNWDGFFSPLRYCPVSDLGATLDFSRVPQATMYPPCSRHPAPYRLYNGDASWIHRAQSPVRCCQYRAGASGLRHHQPDAVHTVGSSHTYKTPIRPLPTWVEVGVPSLDSVEETRSRACSPD